MREGQNSVAHRRRIISRFLFALLVPAILVALVSCVQVEESPECRSLIPPEGEAHTDFVSEYPYAERILDSGGIDMDDVESIRQLGSGWSFVEGSDRKHVWSVGLSSVIRFVNLKKRDKILKFRCLPFVYEGMKTQRIKVFLNDSPIGETELRKSEKSYSFDLPASKLKKGENMIEFQYANCAIPAEVNPELKDYRNLAVSFLSIEIHPVSRDHFSIQKSAGGCETIRQPADTILDYYLALPRRAVLVTAVADSAEAQGLNYEVSVTEDAVPEETVLEKEVEIDRSLLDRIQFWKRSVHWMDTRVPLTGHGGNIVRLRFKVSSSRDDDAHGFGSWLAPRIVAEDAAHSETAGTVLHGSQTMAETAGGKREQYPNANIFIYVIDALRADHVGCYGYHRDTTPAIDRFARDSVLFERFIVESSWTRPSVASIMTGLPQRLHGVQGYEDGLDDSIRFISELLRERGYTTAFISTNQNLSDIYGFDKGFDFFKVGGLEKLSTSSQQVTEAALRWLGERKGKPIFLYLHTTDPHSPYEPKEEFNVFKTAGGDAGSIPPMAVKDLIGRPADSITEEDLNNLRDLYDGEILQNDTAFGVFIDALKQWGLYDNSIIILTADHGEEFFEHRGFAHGRTVYSESVHIPFIIKLPGQRFKGNTIDTLAQTIDVSPTLLDLVGIPVPDDMSGVSLQPVLNGKETEDRTLSSEINMEGLEVNFASVYWKKWKLDVPYGRKSFVRVKDGEPLELFDIENDWEETRNLHREYPVMTGYLHQILKKDEFALDEKAKQFGKPVKIRSDELPEDVRNGLKALGYLN